MEKEKLKKILTKAVEFQKGKEMALGKEFVSLEEKIDESVELVSTKIEDTKSELEERIKTIELTPGEKGEQGEKGEDGEDGKDYILTDSDKKEIASQVEVPIVEKVIEKTETIIEKPIVTEITTNEIKEVAKYETSEQIVGKINKGDTLIKKDKIEGLSDIEYNLKHNLYTGISETRALELIRTTAPSVDLTGYVPYSGLSASNVTANTLTYFNASKQASSVTLGSGLSLSAGTLSLAISSPTTNITVSGSDIDVNTGFAFNWSASHTWAGDIETVHIVNSDLAGGIHLQNGDAEARPYLRFSDSSNTYFLGFVAPNFEASQPQFYWTLPEQDASGVWQSDGAGILSIAPVVLTTQVSGILPYANGGTNASTAWTQGSVIFAGATGLEQDNSNFFWDNTNNRLGIGTSGAPQYTFQVTSGNVISSYFSSTGASHRIGINHASNTGFGLYIANALKWSITSVNGGGGGSNPDLVFYNDQTSTNTLWLDGNNNNVSIGVIAPSTTNKFHIESTYTTSASRIAYFKGTSGTSGLEVRTNGQAQYMARSSTHTDRELRFQMFSDGHCYFGTQGLSGAITSNLIIRTGADSGSNAGSVLISPAGTQRITVTGSLGVGIGNGAVTPSAYLTLGAGTATAGTAPLRFTSGTLLTTPVAGAVEFLTDKYYGTITTGAARKEFTLNDIALTSGRVPYITTNGRLTDSANLAYTSGTGLLVSDNIKMTTAGNGLYVKEGTNATMGVATLVAGTVTVNTTKVTANSRIFLTRQTASGTLGASVDVTARTAGTSFTITSNGSVLDTSDVAWIIVEPS